MPSGGSPAKPAPEVITCSRPTTSASRPMTDPPSRAVACVYFASPDECEKVDVSACAERAKVKPSCCVRSNPAYDWLVNSPSANAPSAKIIAATMMLLKWPRFSSSPVPEEKLAFIDGGLVRAPAMTGCSGMPAKPVDVCISTPSEISSLADASSDQRLNATLATIAARRAAGWTENLRPLFAREVGRRAGY